jgi:protein TonB
VRRFLLAASIAVLIHVLMLGMEFEWLRGKFSYTPGPGVVTLTLAHYNSPKAESKPAITKPRILPKKPVVIKEARQRKRGTPSEKVLKSKEADKELTQINQEEITKVISDIAHVPKPREPDMVNEANDSWVEFDRDMVGDEAVQEASEMPSVASVQGIREARPIYLRNPSPEYPRLARRRGYQGTVVLEVLVDQKGRVGDLKVFQSSGHTVLDKAAMTSVKEWLFEPAIRGNERVETWVKVPIRFQLK